MPTGEDIMHHGENCSACQSGTRCEEGQRLVDDHLREVNEGIVRMMYTTVTGRTRSDRPNISAPPRGQLKHTVMLDDFAGFEKDVK